MKNTTAETKNAEIPAIVAHTMQLKNIGAMACAFP